MVGLAIFAMVHIVIRGNIGAGKTTAGRLVAAKLGGTFVPEPVDEWVRSGALAAMYSGQKAAFQAYALATRVANRQFTVGRSSNIVVLDRWLDDDKAFAVANLTTEEYAAYEALWDVTAAMNDVGVTWSVWLDVPVDVCAARIARRGRPEEVGITAGYLCSLDVFKNVDAVVSGDGEPDQVAGAIVDAFNRWRGGPAGPRPRPA